MSRNARQDRSRSRGLELDSVPSCSLDADEDGIWDGQSIQQSGHACPLSRWANSSKGTRLSTIEPKSTTGKGRRLDPIQQPSLDPDDSSDAEDAEPDAEAELADAVTSFSAASTVALAVLLVLLVLAAGGGVASLISASSAVRPQRHAMHQTLPPPPTVVISPAVDVQRPISMPLSMLLTPPPTPPPLAPPPSPAPRPRPPPPPPAAVEALNLQFRDGRPSKSLDDVGVVVHTFDSMEDSSEPWKPCPAQEHSCAFVRDRMSASIVSERNGIALYSTETAGLLMSGARNKLLCVYVAE